MDSNDQEVLRTPELFAQSNSYSYGHEAEQEVTDYSDLEKGLSNVIEEVSLKHPDEK